MVLLSGCAVVDPGGGASDPASADGRGGEVRRMCLQNGTAGIGGGTLVRLLGDDGAGTLTVENLNGVRASIPARGEAGQETLCAVRAGAMRICATNAKREGDVPYLESLSSEKGGAGASAGTIPRGAPVELWDLVHDGGGKGKTLAFVKIAGAQRFVPGDEICFAEEYPRVSRVTERLNMIPRPAAPNTFRPRPPSTISRIVVHNTEETLATTLDFFTSGSKGTSSHVVIDRDGTLYRLVEDQYAAYHAGGSADGMGNYNNSSLGVEVVAYPAEKAPDGVAATGLTDAQRESLTALLRAWMEEYHLAIDPQVMANEGTAAGYADLEYARAALSIHRLSKAGRGTDCPRLLWDNSPEGDEAFFRWRERTFGASGQ